jgi:uncharacterized C2H2 Zn-finger protein
MISVYKCTLCGRLAYSQTDAGTHLKEAHPGTEARMELVRYRCPRCGLLLNHPSDLRNHMLREHRVYVPAGDGVGEEVVSETTANPEVQA